MQDIFLTQLQRTIIMTTTHFKLIDSTSIRIALCTILIVFREKIVFIKWMQHLVQLYFKFKIFFEKFFIFLKRENFKIIFNCSTTNVTAISDIKESQPTEIQTLKKTWIRNFWDIHLSICFVFVKNRFSSYRFYFALLTV